MQGVTQIFVGAFVDVWATVVGFLPEFFAACIFLGVGLIVASGLQTIVERLVAATRIDILLSKAGAGEYAERAGIRIDMARFLSRVVYWFVIIASMLGIANILGLRDVADFLQGSILTFIPKIVIAVGVMLITVVIANFFRGAIRASAMSVRFHAGKILGSVAWWAVIVFGSLEALRQVGIDIQIAWALLNTIVTGVVAMLAIAGGIAFGLGGKEYASRALGRFENEFKKEK